MTAAARWEPSLFDSQGRRKYLSFDEVLRFLRAADRRTIAVKLFCLTIAYTGCRISEALELTPRRLDVGVGCIVLRTLKRRRVVFRAVPIPPALMRELVLYSLVMGRDDRLWPWCRQTGWKRVKEVMEAAEVSGEHACPKGLRHGYGIALAQRDVMLPQIKRWMGHARLQTTEIYLQAVGEQEREFADRLWRDYAKR